MDRRLEHLFVDDLVAAEFGRRSELRFNVAPAGPALPGGAPKIDNAPAPEDAAPPADPAPPAAEETDGAGGNQAKTGAANIAKENSAQVEEARKPDAAPDVKTDAAVDNGSVSDKEKEAILGDADATSDNNGKLTEGEAAFADKKPNLDDAKKDLASDDPAVRDAKGSELVGRYDENNELIGRIDLKVAVLDGDKAVIEQKRDELAEQQLPGVVGELRESDQKFDRNGRPDGTGNTYGSVLEEDQRKMTDQELAAFIVANPDHPAATYLKGIEDYARDHPDEGNLPEVAKRQVLTQINDRQGEIDILEEERARLVGEDGNGGLRGDVVRENQQIDEAFQASPHFKDDNPIDAIRTGTGADLDADVPGDPTSTPEARAAREAYDQQQRLVNDTAVFPPGAVVAQQGSGTDASGQPIDGRIVVPVQEGESYWAIAERYSQFANVPFEQLFQDIVNANHGRQSNYASADSVGVGDQVVLPPYLSERLLNP